MQRLRLVGRLHAPPKSLSKKQSMFSSPAGGAGELFSSPAKGFVEASGGGGGGGLTQAQVQVLIDSSLGGAVQPSSVTTAGAVVSSTAFSFDAGNDGEESKIEREGHGGLLVKRGGLTFISFSLFTGATFGVNLTTGNLTVKGISTPPSGGISGFYSSAAVDNLLSAKQNTITTNSLAISNVANLQSSLDAKQSLLSDQSGTGVTLRDGSVIRRVFGVNGISVTVPLNIANANDPEHF